MMMMMDDDYDYDDGNDALLSTTTWHLQMAAVTMGPAKGRIQRNPPGIY